MTSSRFDDLTKALGERKSRRSVLKALAAAAFGGVALSATGESALAASRQACNRLHQSCGAGQPACCAHLACLNGDCCRPLNETCYADSDCCPDNVCRPNPHGMGNRCLPPGGVGAACVEQADCASGLSCDIYTGTCQAPCLPDGTECDEDVDCCNGFCDAYTGLCGSNCGGGGDPCSSGSDCCSGECDPYTLTCTGCVGIIGECFSEFDCCPGLFCVGIGPGFGYCIPVGVPG